MRWVTTPRFAPRARLRRCGVAAYIHTSRLVEADARDRLHDLLGATVAGLDANAHAQIHTEADRAKPEHAQLVTSD
jgi:hypothetical protein